ncbi:ribosomal protein S18-alanine N-acetyltransferase [Nocardioides coralli]|uniref:ribosomal protein S18-alanine N-acetyltransferase n=1 Tax=Nocardioides coralli TaxID=2872154 RepID=UPI001CA3E8BD|nr:ribosomal protein S18-alanine N-acetyltransferase [Nocardioides coralli]QZY28561.1 ribosomal protein S18-alanine N-acetyltransferase [Nocardioides coralli]
MIGRATTADVPAIARLEQVALGRDAWSEGLVRDGVTGGVPSVHYLVARSGSRLVGYAVASAVADLVELQRIAVDPAYRRSGVATALLDDVVDLAVAEGAERIMLEVREDNVPALAFYGENGFRELDRRPRYYRDGATAVVLERLVSGPPTSV